MSVQLLSVARNWVGFDAVLVNNVINLIVAAGVGCIETDLFKQSACTTTDLHAPQQICMHVRNGTIFHLQHTLLLLCMMHTIYGKLLVLELR